MNTNHKRRGFSLYLLEISISVMIIIILLCIAAYIYPRYLRCARVIHAVGHPYDLARLNIMNYFFMHGEWPENSNEAMKSGLNINYAPYSDNFIKEVTVSNGAIHFTFGKELPGKTLTLRPAVPAEDPSGPIVWVCGDSKASKNWAIQGDNRTNIDERYIPRSWR